MKKFLNDCCTVGADLRVTGRELFQAHNRWAGQHRGKRLEMAQLGAAIMRAGKFGRDRSGPRQGYGRIWTGLSRAAEDAGPAVVANPREGDAEKAPSARTRVGCATPRGLAACGLASRC